MRAERKRDGNTPTGSGQAPITEVRTQSSQRTERERQRRDAENAEETRRRGTRKPHPDAERKRAAKCAQNKSGEEFINELIAGDFQMAGNVGENLGERTDFERSVRRNGDVVLRLFASRGKPHVTARLPSHLIAEAKQCPGEFRAADITGHLQAGMTSSFTRWRRIMLGFSASAKWHATASRSMDLSSSSESACEKMEWPRARAS